MVLKFGLKLSSYHLQYKFEGLVGVGEGLHMKFLSQLLERTPTLIVSKIKDCSMRHGELNCCKLKNIQ